MWKDKEFLFLPQSTAEECLYKQKHWESKQTVANTSTLFFYDVDCSTLVKMWKVRILILILWIDEQYVQPDDDDDDGEDEEEESHSLRQLELQALNED